MNPNEIATKQDIASLKEDLASIKQLLESKPRDKSVLRSIDVKTELGISDSTLQRLRISGKITCQKVNGTWFYKKQDIVNFSKTDLK